jgi:hypothetical protein
VLLQHVANFGLEGLAAVSEQLDVIPEQACARWCALAAQQNTAKRNQRSTWTPAELAVVIKVRQITCTYSLVLSCACRLARQPGLTVLLLYLQAYLQARPLRTPEGKLSAHAFYEGKKNHHSLLCGARGLAYLMQRWPAPIAVSAAGDQLQEAEPCQVNTTEQQCLGRPCNRCHNRSCVEVIASRLASQLCYAWGVILVLTSGHSRRLVL